MKESKVLGLIISDDLKWNSHVREITKKAGQRIHMLAQIKHAGVPPNDIVAMCCAKIRPILEYACQAWHPGLTEYLSHDIERIQKRALWVIFPKLTYEDALCQSKLVTLAQRCEQFCLTFVTKNDK